MSRGAQPSTTRVFRLGTRIAEGEADHIPSTEVICKTALGITAGEAGDIVVSAVNSGVRVIHVAGGD